MSNELVDDLKLSNLEISEELGIRLTSANANIKHTTKGGSLNIKSDGAIYIQGGDYDSDDHEDNDSEAGDIIIEGGDSFTVRDGGDVELRGGDVLENGTGDGGRIYIRAGESNNSSDAGYVEIYGGYNSGNGDAGNIYIESGYAENGYGGDLEFYAGSANGVTGGVAGGNIYIESGSSYDGITGSFVEIKGGSANTTGGDVNIYGGYGYASGLYNGNINLTASEIHLNGGMGGSIEQGITGGALSLETLVSSLSILDINTNTVSLEDGFLGQMKVITVINDGGGITGNVVLGNGDLNRLGYTTITFNNIGDTVSLVFVPGGWVVAGSRGVDVS